MNYISETMEKIASAKTKQEKITILRKYYDENLRIFLEFILNPAIVSEISTLPPYKELKCPVDLGMMNMNEAMKKSYLFINNHPRVLPGITPRKREILLIQLLEALSADDARFYGMMVLKRLPKELNRGLIKEALGVDYK